MSGKLQRGAWFVVRGYNPASRRNTKPFNKLMGAQDCFVNLERNSDSGRYRVSLMFDRKVVGS